jgi:predicted permease
VWRSQFNADRGVLGRAVELDGQPYTVIGVMPDGFDSQWHTAVWTTLAPVGATIGNGSNLEAVGRLKDGVTLAAARGQLAQLMTSFQATFARDWPKSLASIDLASYRRLTTGDIETPILLLSGSIAFVLLIACANVANLLLSRAATRTREMGVRVAIGASRGRLVRQLLTESVVLAVVSGALSLLLAEWALDQMLVLVPRSLPSTAAIAIDRTVLMFTGGVSLITGLVFGLVPAWLTTRGGIAGALKDSARGSTGGKLHGRFRDVLVAGEVAVSLVLLAAAGLLLRTFAGLAHTDPGFDPSRVAAAEIWITGPRYTTTAAITNFYTDVVRKLDGTPGISAAAVIEAGLPLRRGGNEGVRIDGQGDWISADYRTVTPDYFRTLGVPLVSGRMFGPADGETTLAVALVNQAFAKRYLAGHAAVGTSLVGGDFSARQIVGVVGNVRSEVTQDAVPTVFLASAQTPAGLTTVFNNWYPIHVVARTTGDPRAALEVIKRAIHDADPLVPVGDVQMMDDVLSATLATQRFTMSLLLVFAILACVLSAVGLYGVINYLVTQRTHEMGIRMALGARAADVRRLILARGLGLAGVGVAVGLGGAIAATRLLKSQLYAVVSATDPVTLVGAAVGLLLVAGLAAYVPARRASRVDPIVALRHE